MNSGSHPPWRSAISVIAVIRCVFCREREREKKETKSIVKNEDEWSLGCRCYKSFGWSLVKLQWRCCRHNVVQKKGCPHCQVKLVGKGSSFVKSPLKQLLTFIKRPWRPEGFGISCISCLGPIWLLGCCVISVGAVSIAQGCSCWSSNDQHPQTDSLKPSLEEYESRTAVTRIWAENTCLLARVVSFRFSLLLMWWSYVKFRYVTTL